MNGLLNREFKLKNFLIIAILLMAGMIPVTVVAYEALTVDIIVTGNSSDGASVGIGLPGRSYFVDDINNSTLFQKILVWELDDAILEIQSNGSGQVDVTIQGYNYHNNFSYSKDEYTVTQPPRLPLSSQMDNNSSFRLTWGEIPAGMARILVVGEFDDAELVSPTGEKISLQQDAPIFVPADEAERYVVHVMGDKKWADIAVTSFDGKARWASALEDSSGVIYQAGDAAITSYHWDN